MRYITTTMGANESVIKAVRQTKWQYCSLLNICTLGLFTPFIWFRRWTLEMAITNKRVAIKAGFISRATNEIRVEAIESCLMKQGILGRIFGFGDLAITGRGNNVITFNSVAGVVNVKREIETARG